MPRLLRVLLAATACLCVTGGQATAAKPSKIAGTYSRVVPSGARYDAFALAGSWTLTLTTKSYLYEHAAGDVLGVKPQPLKYADHGSKLLLEDRQEPVGSPCRKATYRVKRIAAGLRFKAITDKCQPRRLLLQSGVWKPS